MKWSLKPGEIRGVGLYMHATFLILIRFVVLSHYFAGHSLVNELQSKGLRRSLPRALAWEAVCSMVPKIGVFDGAAMSA